MDNRPSIISDSPECTRRLGYYVGEMAIPGDIVLLSGPLGAGKTCLAQGIAYGLGAKEEASSPSYVLVREIHGRIPLYHMDLYRLEFDEISELGLDEYLAGDGICVIEWAERWLSGFPEEHLRIQIEYCQETGRKIHIFYNGARYEFMGDRILQLFSGQQKS